MDKIGMLKAPQFTAQIGDLGSALKVGKAAMGALVDAGEATSSAGFSNAISSALDSVSAQQASATHLSKEFQLENPNVSLEETVIAMQKASLGFQATVQVRNKVVQAYNDLMNMTV